MESENSLVLEGTRGDVIGAVLGVCLTAVGCGILAKSGHYGGWILIGVGAVFVYVLVKSRMYPEKFRTTIKVGDGRLFVEGPPYDGDVGFVHLSIDASDVVRFWTHKVVVNGIATKRLVLILLCSGPFQSSAVLDAYEAYLRKLARENRKKEKGGHGSPVESVSYVEFAAIYYKAQEAFCDELPLVDSERFPVAYVELIGPLGLHLSNESVDALTTYLQTVLPKALYVVPDNPEYFTAQLED